MLKKILHSVDKIFKRSSLCLLDDLEETPFNITKRKCVLEQKHISDNALETIKGLHKAGYDAYLVGGCIRDLLLNLQPKDFDVATNATPEQVKKIFKNSRIIGRRFKLVHVLWGRETIEVATFRAPHSKASAGSAQDSRGRLLRDNVYGSIDEDAYRRDFTVNALYYDINKQQVLDYTGGLVDIDNGLIQLIGDPVKRYKEDPVRMLRAVRFVAKLNFSVGEFTEKAIYQYGSLLADIPAARLFDEVLKLFLSGNAVRTFELLCQYKLFEYLFPATAKILEVAPEAQKFIHQALLNTDVRLQQGKTINPAFLYSCFLWPVLLSELKEPFSGNTIDLIKLQEIADKIIVAQCKYTSIPKRYSVIIKEIWIVQLRLTKRQGKKADILLVHPRFRAGYDFLLLRESVGEETGNLGWWWTNYQQADEMTRRKMIRQVTGDKKTTYKKRRYFKPKVVVGSDDNS